MCIHIGKAEPLSIVKTEENWLFRRSALALLSSVLQSADCSDLT